MKKNFTRLMLLTLLSGFTAIVHAQTPVAYWKLDDNTLKEEINNLAGTLQGSTTNPFVSAAVGSGIDYAQLDQQTGGVAIAQPTTVEFTTGSFSLSAVVKLNKVFTTEQDIIAKGWRAAAVDGHWYALYISTGGQYTFAVDDNVTKTDMKYAIPAAYDGWVHLVAVRNTGTAMLELYANGVQVLTKADATTQSIASPAYPLMIGNTNEGNSRYGSIIDEVKIFNVALTQTEITAMFDAGNVNSDGTLKTVGVKNLASTKIEFYPNPAKEKIILKNATELSVVKIYSIDGKLVKSVKVSSNEIGISELKNGLYYLSATGKNGKTVLTTKISKN